MAARAIWKGVLQIDQCKVPVKLYSALNDRSVHFRLLHRRDQAPVQQVMINAQTHKPVPPAQIRKAYQSNDKMILLTQDDLDDIQAQKSRVIEVSEFLPRGEIEQRWFERPYYLGADGKSDLYDALGEALAGAQSVGLARWSMRNKEYIGALDLFCGYPVLLTMRSAQQVVSLSELDAPTGEALNERDLVMARQLISMLEAEFSPTEYADEYRQRVMEMIEQKRQGKKVKKLQPKSASAPRDLNQALRESLARARA